VIDPVPEGTENLIETEEVPEAEQSESEGSSPEPEATPAFKFGLAVAGLGHSV
jgi:hypothetical protein